MTIAAEPPVSETPVAPRPIACMEVWGGHSAFAGAVSLPGNDVTLSCEPFNGDAQGGDIYYLSNCAAGIITRFVLADVAGHGAKVASLAATLRDLMRRHINTADQSRLAQALSTAFGRASPEGRFATAILLTYFAPSDHLIVCNAGHPRPLCYRVATGQWQLLDAGSEGTLASARAAQTGISNLPLGILDPTDYHQFALHLDRGDLVILYSDALIEAAPPGGPALGESGLLRMVLDLDPSHPEFIGAHLRNAVLAYTGEHRLPDDQTVIVLHHNAANPPRPGLLRRAAMLASVLGMG